MHEIAHQWFYGIISNDPYHDAWLDEGLTEFADSILFYTEYKGLDFDVEQSEEQLKEYPLSVNLSLDEFPLGTQSTYIYGKSLTSLMKIFKQTVVKKMLKNFLKVILIITNTKR